MNKQRLIERIAATADLSKAQAGWALDAVIKNIELALAQGDSVNITGFGKFTVSERSARTGRNPQTGETIQIAASKVPKFSPGKDFKRIVNR